MQRRHAARTKQPTHTPIKRNCTQGAGWWQAEDGSEVVESRRDQTGDCISCWWRGSRCKVSVCACSNATGQGRCVRHVECRQAVNRQKNKKGASAKLNPLPIDLRALSRIH